MKTKKNNDNENKQIIDLVKKTLSKLYEDDKSLFVDNNGKGLCERCIVFRFAHYLQNEIKNYKVDCDYNNSKKIFKMNNTKNIIMDSAGKTITNPDGTETKRFIDIIVHNRNDENFIAFEFKKWNNTKKEQMLKDFNNLRVLTSGGFRYKLGFSIILGATEESIKFIIFENGRVNEKYTSYFPPYLNINDWI